jgi:hypothetical protein
MRHKCFGFAEFMLAIGGNDGDEAVGHLRLLVSISFLFYFFVWDGKGEGVDGRSGGTASKPTPGPSRLTARVNPTIDGAMLRIGRPVDGGRLYKIVVTAEESSQCHNERGYTWRLNRKRGRASDVTKN